MKENLIDLDRAFTEHYKKLLDIQNSLYEQYKTYDFDLNKSEITDAICQRMTAFWHFNYSNTHEVLNRNVTTPAADFFTETCMLFIKAYFENKYDLSVRSELSIVPGRNAIRPDISIWKGKELVAVIELKVNNGWKGKSIIPHLIERESRIKSHHPNAFFGVISFWNFFSIEDNNWRVKYVGLQTYDQANNHPRTDGTVEDIMKQIVKRIELDV